jgi:putative oxidoreductase
MDFGLLLLRSAVGLTMVAHGAQKLFGWFGGYGLDATGQFFEQIGFVPGRRHARAAGVVEAGGGLLLALGFLTPIAAAGLVAVMIVAVATVHGKHGFFATSQGFEYNFILGAAALAMAFTGPGSFSVDAVAGLSSGGAVWGVGSLVLAVAGSLIPLAQRRIPTAASAHA